MQIDPARLPVGWSVVAKNMKAPYVIFPHTKVICENDDMTHCQTFKLPMSTLK